ncbi:peptidase C45 acyl-coenzyme A:6-aminopenicillanic acid acyl-transferase [Penicillium waksmanii]|uniref:peptidase C45 acyl-coenzyme A:6-aminopenicillanic acid acyl-transferase n=1 Tax=Penicillium waksmanii TaxID=69791 RepID=UPI002548E2AB|nr:peptidase C45 acyl-coenzyme A:6-aminopenicillanic acid acyl-transferase [Penicillium waksmanii]KAJ5981014.1 peptidase C45 acyl-coenzyme A:6-aminopenicillanic acid acyl-transferase [Penicillium waksmanii]
MRINAEDKNSYQHVVVHGLPYDRGLSHGQQAKDKVQANVEYYKQPGKLAERDVMHMIIKNLYIPNIEAHYPAGLEEMKGIADGASVSLEDIVLLNARYDLARLNRPADNVTRGISDSNGHTLDGEYEHAHECTSSFFLKETTASGDVLNAQNWDMSARLWLTDAIIYLEVHPDPSEGKPSLFLVTEAGQLGRSGMNSLGIGVTANSLMSTEDYSPDQRVDDKAVMPISLLRRMVLECSHISEAFTAIQQFPRHVSNNLTLATAEGFGMCLEITPSRVYKVYCDIDDSYLIHTNHFTEKSFLSRDDVYDRYPGGSSWFRRQRLEQGVRPYTKGLLTTEQLIKAFSDHLSYPEALCCHPDKDPLDRVIGDLPGYPFRGTTATVTCVIYNLSQGTITTCKGPPCQGHFKTFSLGGPRNSIDFERKKNGEGIERPEVP